MKTITFKSTPQINLQADIYGADTSNPAPKPAILWIHGGALIMGTRTKILPEHVDAYTNAGFAVIAIDYRLAPETKLPAIVEDIEDAVTWIRTTAAAEYNLDPNRLAVIGHSAGGYLTLLTGHRVTPAPKALIAFYGYGNIAGEWYSKPDPFYSSEYDLFTEEQAHAAVGTEEITDGSADPNRRNFYLWCRQNGLWASRVAGHDPVNETDWFTPYSPEDNVRPNEYPPTLLIHGNNDTDVPYEQSVLMASKLKASGTEHNFITIENGPHGFDHNPTSANTPEVKAAFKKVIEFLTTHV
jgi:acetyl esterase/lipase